MQSPTKAHFKQCRAQLMFRADKPETCPCTANTVPSPHHASSVHEKARPRPAQAEPSLYPDKPIPSKPTTRQSRSKHRTCPAQPVSSPRNADSSPCPAEHMYRPAEADVQPMHMPSPRPELPCPSQPSRCLWQTHVQKSPCQDQNMRNLDHALRNLR
jgi:hypothetical protein